MIPTDVTKKSYVFEKKGERVDLGVRRTRRELEGLTGEETNWDVLHARRTNFKF